MKWRAFVSGLGGRSAKFFDEIEDAANASHAYKRSPPAQAEAGDSTLIAKLSQTAEGERRAIVLDYLQSELLKVIGRDALSPSDFDRGFQALGLDSLMSVEFRNKLLKDFANQLGKKLPPALMFDYPNINVLTDYLVRDVFQSLSSSSASAPKATRKVQKNISAREPIAIVGVGCRLPGGISDLESYWQVLKRAGDMITEVPPNRFDIENLFDADVEAPGKIVSRFGGFIKDAECFDAELFEMSAREASEIDPQQRVLLETVWKSLENACINPLSLRGSRTAVYIGASSLDYGRVHQRMRGQDLSGYFGIGTLLPALAGRISYFFGLQGPCFVLDTACSSSLLAIHQACMSLRTGESDMALAGGVNLILSPEISISFSKAHMLSPDGRCKTFSAEANGYVRSEACGIVVLKRLSDAKSNNDRILGVIKGSAANQDGRSGSLTAPNGPAQEALIRESISAAGIKPSDVSLLEAHGTGTPLGDPIEVFAAGNVLGEDRSPDNALYIGSHKANIGHAEAAAGVAGILKIIAAMQNKEIPPQANFTELNPKISLDDIPAKIPLELTPWNPAGRRRIATISSFGFTGSNVNAVIEEAPETTSADDGKRDRAAHVLALSAKSQESLRSLVESYVSFFDRYPTANLADVCFSSATGRAQFDWRLAVVGKTVEEMRRKLASHLELGAVSGVVVGRSPGLSKSGFVFLFSGQGSQFVGMGKELYETNLEFKKWADQCDQILKGLLGRSILPIMFEPTTDDLLNQTRFTQPALFVLEYSLFQVWKSWGIVPSTVIGHSAGEIVAACAAEIMTLEDALSLVVKRAELMSHPSAPGRMVAVNASADVVRLTIENHLDRVSIAAENGPESSVISGFADSVELLQKQFKSNGVATKALTVSGAFHSPLMDGATKEIEEIVSKIKFRPAKIKLISNVTGTSVSDQEISLPSYWSKHLRQPVLFRKGIETAFSMGHREFIEIGPGGTLVGMAMTCAKDADTLLGVFSINKNGREWAQLLESVGEFFVRGIHFDWQSIERGFPSRRKVSVPTYAFAKKKYWVSFSQKRNIVSLSNPSEFIDAPDVAKENGNGRPFVDRLLECNLDLRPEVIVTYLLYHIRAIMGFDSNFLIDPKSNLITLGLESLMAIRLRSILKKELGTLFEVPTDLVTRFPTIEKLAQLLAEGLGAASSSPVTQLQAQRDDGESAGIMGNPWISCLRPQKNAKLRLFCFPYAGGSESAFTYWVNELPEWIEVCSVRLPGRIGRMDEAAPESLDKLADQVFAGIKSALTGPYVFVGYSFGSLLAFEVLTRLVSANVKQPNHFITMAAPGPGAIPHRSFHKLPDEEFIKKLSMAYHYENLNRVFADEAVRKALLPILRSEIKMIETYNLKWISEKKFIFPITAYTGKLDTVATADAAAKWGEMTIGGLGQRSISGGHFFIHDSKSEVIEKLMFDLESVSLKKIAV